MIDAAVSSTSLGYAEGEANAFLKVMIKSSQQTKFEDFERVPENIES